MSALYKRWDRFTIEAPLPEEGEGTDREVYYGFAVDTFVLGDDDGDWWFFKTLDAANAFSRAARENADIQIEPVIYEAALEFRFDPAEKAAGDGYPCTTGLYVGKYIGLGPTTEQTEGAR